MPRVIFDPVAIADGPHHFDIEMRALLHSLRLDDSSLSLEFTLPPFELFENRLNGAFFLLGGQNVVRLRINRHARDVGFARKNFAGERIDAADGFDLATPELDAYCGVFVRWMDFYNVAAHAECAAAKIFGAVVLDVHKPAQHRFARYGLSFFQH